ncbi:Dihydroorotate dehydrogenase (quinone), mitochondrial [Podochytrium sp. JEL0797]|nr:Dihydroorotate dehydrogenase (quinone), mitochondrial [Podochytrium sp. JEL0797]
MASFPPSEDNRILETSFLGLPLSNPVGLAAGFNKHANGITDLFTSGFGLVEIGSVTPLPQPGNPLPRIFRLEEDSAIVNRALMQGRALGVNLGKNKVSKAEDHSDYVKGVVKLGPYADYLVINVSSPNTPGLRGLQRREPMLKLLNEVRQARDTCLSHRPPILVKIAPDVTQAELEDIAAVILESKIDGVVISNTTISRPASLKSDTSLTTQTGGLCGPPVRPLALSKIRSFYALTHGRIPIIGCGGISSPQDAIAFARAGASVVQTYTVLAYQGMEFVEELKRGVVDLLKSEGKTWREVVGSDHMRSKL